MTPDDSQNILTVSIWAAFLGGLMCAELVPHVWRWLRGIEWQRHGANNSSRMAESPVVVLGQNVPSSTGRRGATAALGVVMRQSN